MRRYLAVAGTKMTGRSRWTLTARVGAAAGVGSVFAILLAFSSLAAGLSTVTLSPIIPSTGNATTGTGQFQACGPGVLNSTTGWVCDRAIAYHGDGYARGWSQLSAAVALTNLSGTQQFWGTGALSLARGYAQVRVGCAPGAAASGQVYVFWHVWVYDRTLGTFVDQLNSGYIWNSGLYSCPAGGGTVMVSSPKFSGTFNSSDYGRFSYDFVPTHSYVFTFFLGCTAEAQVSVAGPIAQAAAGAFCNIPGSMSTNTMSLYGVTVT